MISHLIKDTRIFLKIVTTVNIKLLITTIIHYKTIIKGLSPKSKLCSALILSEHPGDLGLNSPF